MKIDLDCPRCDTAFEGEEWHSGSCPTCKNKYWWDEHCTEDYSDCWEFVDWESYDKIKT